MRWWNCWPLLANVKVFSPAFRPFTSNLYSEASTSAALSGSGGRRCDVFDGELAEHPVLVVRRVTERAEVHVGALLEADRRRAVGARSDPAQAAGRAEHVLGDRRALGREHVVGELLRLVPSSTRTSPSSCGSAPSFLSVSVTVPPLTSSGRSNAYLPSDGSLAVTVSDSGVTRARTVVAARDEPQARQQ